MKKLAILAGGDSGEFEISILTANNILNNVDYDLFDPYLVVVNKNEWFCQKDGCQYFIDKNDFSLMIENQHVVFDIVFIAIHGNPGENGKFQGYFDMLHIPYTGCDMFSSALTFNKYFCNAVLSNFGIPIAESVHYFNYEIVDEEHVINNIGFPCFVKPCNSGSSVGVTKVHDKSELSAAISKAFSYDNQLMIEKQIVGREIACGVVNMNGKIKMMAITEIKPLNEFYDYEAKYSDGLHDLITPADISTDCYKKVEKYVSIIYSKLGCNGVVRADFFITKDENVVFLEINTVPGQTAMSIIPCQVKYSGMALKDFYTQLIFEAL